jgi:predicted amidohydrolase
MNQLERLSIAPGTDGRAPGLLVWPEVPTPFSMQDPRFAALTERIAKQTRDGFLAGVIEERMKPGAGWQYFNSAVLHDPSGRQTFLYDKIHLVPFSEYVPWASWFKFIQSITVEVGNFQPGSEYRVGTLPDGRRISVYICYEAKQRFHGDGGSVWTRDGAAGRGCAGCAGYFLRLQERQDAVHAVGRLVSAAVRDCRDTDDGAFDCREKGFIIYKVH